MKKREGREEEEMTNMCVVPGTVSKRGRDLEREKRKKKKRKIEFLHKDR